jgi:hypothetical protein
MEMDFHWLSGAPRWLHLIAYASVFMVECYLGRKKFLGTSSTIDLLSALIKRPITVQQKTIEGVSMQPVTLNVDDEVKALADALASLASDVKNKKAIGNIVADVLPALLPAAAGLGSIGSDIQKVDNQVYVIYSLAKALEAPVPVSVPTP